MIECHLVRAQRSKIVRFNKKCTRQRSAKIINNKSRRTKSKLVKQINVIAVLIMSARIRENNIINFRMKIHAKDALFSGGFIILKI